MILLSQLPAPAPGQLESWLVSAAAAGALAVLARKLFARSKPPIDSEFVTKAEFRLFRDSVERDLNSLRHRLDSRFLMITEKMDEVKTELLAAGERRGSSIHARLNELESGLARVDERTRQK